MLAKTESPAQVQRLSGFTVVALCETALGVVNAQLIAAEPNVAALMWGAEDLIVSLNGTSSRRYSGRYRSVALYARSSVLLAAGAHGKAAIDSVFTDISDLEGLAAEAADAVASGFAAKACIHPNQVPLVRDAYTPTERAVAEARDLLAAAKTAGSGVFQYHGRMVDGPILRHAEAVLRRFADSDSRS